MWKTTAETHLKFEITLRKYYFPLQKIAIERTKLNACDLV